MEIENAIKILKHNIKDIYNKTRKKIGNNIYRGHLRSISTDIEDKIAIFVSNLLPNCKIFLDASIHINNKTHRPDLFILNDKNKVVAMLEIKSNMGWCRNASKVIDSMISNDKLFKKEKTLYCEFSNNDKQCVDYNKKIKLFLVSLTKWNCSDKNHEYNKKYAVKKEVSFYNLFDGWYDSLTDYEIKKFVNDILLLSNQ